MDIENKYYNAKQMKSSEPEDAIDEFLSIPALEPEKGDWGFKGLKQAIKLEFKLCRYDKVGVLCLDERGALADHRLGRRALHRASHLCQVSRDSQLLGEVDQQHARFYRERVRE